MDNPTPDYPDLREMLVGIVIPMNPPTELLDAIRRDPMNMALAIAASTFALRCMEEFRGTGLEEAKGDDALATVQLACLVASRTCRMGGGDDLLQPESMATVLQTCNIMFMALLRQTSSPVSQDELANAGQFIALLTSDKKNSPGLVALKTGLDSTLPMIAADPEPIEEHEGALARMNSFAVQMRTILQIGELSLRTDR